MFAVLRLLPLLLAAFALPAQAGWQNTEWEMTVATVKKLTGASDYPILNDYSSVGNLALLTKRYSAAGFDFNAYIIFDKARRRLSRITIKLVRPDRCDDLRGALLNRYGRPTNESNSTVLKVTNWRDGVAKNYVVFVEIGSLTKPGYCDVQYSKLLDGGSGL